MRKNSKYCDNAKLNSLEKDYVCNDNAKLTTNMGVGIKNTDDSLKAGGRGPTLMEDFIFREKITHFDHERIPERIVHARGTGAHGHFQVYESLKDITKAQLFSDPNTVTPIFMRFSTVAGFRGSPDTVRDVRGFAIKFYTKEGNYDIVGNNMPVFFIQDAIKFPDVIHAVKPEPTTEMPQAASAHDTFWDFVSCNHETAHNVMWLMSDRAIPRSYRMMEGFGIHTFKFVNERGDFKFVKLHFKPLLGVHSLVWDETQKIAGKDSDFNRRDLYDAIDNGNFPEWEMCIQVLDPKDEFKFDFDILDATKLWPEEIIPIRKVGKLTLDHNVTNFFSETEQVAFCPGNLVPGIDFTNDPLLQGRLFSYTDTQLSRLGGPNFHQIPINRPIVAVNNNQRDGMHRMTIDQGVTAYSTNSLQNNEPHPASTQESAFVHHQEKVEGHVIRNRSDSFNDFFTQPSMFFNSMSEPEKKHIIDAFRFELGKVKNKKIRQNVVDMFNNVDGELSRQIALGIGAVPPAKPNKPKSKNSSPALSMAKTVFTPKTLKVGILAECGFCKAETDAVINALTAAGACYEIISGALGQVSAMDSSKVEVAQTYKTTASVLYDAIFIPGGAEHVKTIRSNGDAMHYLNETFKHFKPLSACGDAVELVKSCSFKDVRIANKPGEIVSDKGVVTALCQPPHTEFANAFVAALSKMRFFERDCSVDCIQA